MNVRTLRPGVSTPPLSITLIIACTAVFMMQVSMSVPRSLALWPVGSGLFELWQPVSYAFLHGSWSHLFFNMFALWMFGLPIERAWGTSRFASFYLACVLGAAFTQLVVQWFAGEMWPTIGASGGVFGLLLAFGVTFPENRVLLIFFPVPIKAKWFVLIYGVLELVFGVTGAMPGVAHFAHLGGLVFGALLLLRWGWRPGMTWRR
ncbi:MAG: rhomboid family intramembrane serine protease [Xanthomonadales bacterium]|nr:rhomboid family intramembrane serine protease [Xanthomonadales bacterium]